MGFWSFWDTPPKTDTQPNDAAETCPVDKNARSIWLQQQQERRLQRTHPSATDACPVDPSARSSWLQQHQRNLKTRTGQPTQTYQSLPAVDSLAASSGETCSSSAVSQKPISPNVLSNEGPNLSNDRVVSSIPRAFAASEANDSVNAETSSPQTSRSGNWIYPSEAQFFQAVIRKNHNTPNTSPENLAETVSSIIPIHNAVNERAWVEIREWESKFSSGQSENGGKESQPCPPKLMSFQGSGAGPDHDTATPSGLIMSYLSLLNPRSPLTPRARWNSFVGYQVPFDRHDWVVERCNGEQIEYVIDFYQGKEGTRHAGRRNLNFYLDVRPKLSSLEGARMRFRRAFGG